MPGRLFPPPLTFTCPAVLLVLLSLAAPAEAQQLPPPPDGAAMADWSFPWADDVPGGVSAAGLLDKPAGRDGPVVARDGHFYSGDKRVRFVGVNLAFAANFPPHESADALAKRLAGFGVNCVRFHHMDNQPFPNGIFADRELEKLSPEALDRLDYLIAALKREGVYADLNLHVSRPWSRTKKWPNAGKIEGYDKQVDIFHPDLIAANKHYARDLLTHVNAYTKARYADEPAVAMVEINNEDTLFMWGGEQKLATLPEPYAGLLQKQWNEWLTKKYGTRDKLAAAWAEGAEPLGAELVGNVTDATSKWTAEQHDGAKMRVSSAEVSSIAVTRLLIDAVDGTDWHLQYSHPGLGLKKGKFYTLQIRTMNGDGDARSVGVAVGMAHEPWSNLGLSRAVKLEPANNVGLYTMGFVAAADDNNARVALQLGSSTGRVDLVSVSLREGGREGLRDPEDPAAGSVARGGAGSSGSPPRTRDWYAFLQATDEAYFSGMRDWLRTEVGVKAPITGTIGLGILGTKSQRGMDFVDAHSYWDHPHFPRRQWDMRDWEIKNRPMVDDPAGATLWGLAATRVLGKPFTVTEYNHAAPNEWQAECVPMIFAYAALQDWDAVFLFDYSGDAKYQKDRVSNFFSIDGNAAKMAPLPLAARMFLVGGVKPLVGRHVEHPSQEVVLDTASRYFFQQWPYLRDVGKVTWQDALGKQLAITFEPHKPGGEPADAPAAADTARVAWTAGGPGTGRFVLADPAASAFVGFAKGEFPVNLGPSVRLNRLETPFATVQVVPADAGKSVADSDRVLVSAVAREANTGQQWDAKRTSVSDKWGKGPARVEVVKGELAIASARPAAVWALGADGKRTKQVSATSADGWVRVPLGAEPTVWYEVVRH